MPSVRGSELLELVSSQVQVQEVKVLLLANGRRRKQRGLLSLRGKEGGTSKGRRKEGGQVRGELTGVGVSFEVLLSCL